MEKQWKIFGVVVVGFAIIYFSYTEYNWRLERRAIVQQVAPLIEQCKSRYWPGALPAEIDSINSSVYLCGKALVWDMTSNTLSNADGKLPYGLSAGQSDSKITVFMVLGKRDVMVGTYSVSGQPGYREYIDIAVAYWPEKKAAGIGSIISKEPVQSRPVSQTPEYGDTSEPIAQWIASLPRKDNN